MFLIFINDFSLENSRCKDGNIGKSTNNFDVHKEQKLLIID